MKKQVVMSMQEYSDLMISLDHLSYDIKHLKDDYWKNELTRHLEDALNACDLEEE